MEVERTSRKRDNFFYCTWCDAGQPRRQLGDFLCLPKAKDRTDEGTSCEEESRPCAEFGSEVEYEDSKPGKEQE